MAGVTMRDVGARAGVSAKTVSIVLNKNGYVSELLTARVLQAVQDLGYRPNNIARNLRRQSTETAGIILPTILSPFFAPVLREIGIILAAEGLSMLFAHSDYDQPTEASLISLMHDKRVDGLLIAPCSAANTSRLRHMLANNIPVVTFHHALPDDGLDSIAWDDLGASMSAVRHLIARGRSRIAILCSDNSALAPRLEGYSRALQEAGIEEEPSLRQIVAHGDQFQSKELGRQAILRACRGPRLPDAIFIAGSDYAALGVIEGAREVGARIPEDLAVVAYDDLPWMASLAPPLSVVARDGVRLGQLAAEMLVRKMKNGLTGQPEHIILPANLVIRESSAPGAQGRAK